MNNPLSTILQIFRNMANFVVLKKPLGIWMAWGAIVYTMFIFRGKLEALLFVQFIPWQAFAEYLTSWTILVATASALSRRRAIARIFGAMTMTLLLFHSMFWGNIFGIVLSVYALFGLIATRRWFDERLPRTC